MSSVSSQLRRGRRVAVSLLVATGVLVSACGGADDDDESSTEQTTTLPPPVAESEPAVDGSELEVDEAAFQTRLHEFIDRSGATAVMASIQIGDDAPVVLGASPEPSEPPPSDMRFRVGSVSKVLVGALILSLVRDGELALDDRLAAFEPEFPGADEITIEHLLRQTSGIPPQGGEAEGPYGQEWNEFVVAHLQSEVTSDEVMALVGERPLLFEPGTAFQYSNVNAILLGRIAEQVTGQSFPEALREQVLDPLGLGATAVWPTDPEADPPDEGFVLVEGEPVSTEQYPAVGVLSAIGAAGAAVTTVEDLATFGSAYFRDHEPIGDELAASAFAIDGFGAGAGVLGFTLDGACVFAPGGCPADAAIRAVGGVGNVPGGAAVVLYNPTADLVVTVLANREGAPVELLGNILMDGVLQPS